jgi:hypothetical protein
MDTTSQEALKNRKRWFYLWYNSFTKRSWEENRPFDSSNDFATSIELAGEDYQRKVILKIILTNNKIHSGSWFEYLTIRRHLRRRYRVKKG